MVLTTGVAEVKLLKTFTVSTCPYRLPPLTSIVVSASALVLIADVGGAFPKFTVLTTGVDVKPAY